MTSIQEFWVRFLKSNSMMPHVQHREEFHFADDEKTANELLQLVLDGKKKATTASLLAYEKAGERTPKPGDYCIVTEFGGVPRAVIETTSVMILPFCEMKQEIADREGEGLTLEQWREVHLKSFKREAEEMGIEFTENSPIVFEDFKLVYSEVEPISKKPARNL